MYHKHKTAPHRHFVLLIAVTVLISLTMQRTVSAEELHPDSLTAKEIIKRMEEQYANSKSYSDSGVVKIVIIGTDSRQTVQKPFTTAFIRPDRFRFEYREKKHDNREFRFIVYRKGKDVQTYYDVDKGIRKPESLNRALARATGVSGGSAQTVPAMLLPSEIKWRRAIRFHEPKRIDDDIFDKVECFRIHDFILGSHVTFWIGKRNFLLRKIYLEQELKINLEQEFEDFRSQETTIYKPILNDRIIDDMLEFNPPKEKP